MSTSEKVGVVEVADGAGRHRRRQVGGVAGAGGHLDLGGEDAALVVEADLVVVVEAMALASRHEVVIAIEPELDRPAEFFGGDRRHAGEQGGLRFLATEAATHPPHLDRHLVGREVQRVRHQMLHFRGVLGRAIDQHAVLFFGHGVGDLALEIELLLPADPKLFLKPVRRGRKLRRGIAAHEMHRRHDEGTLPLRLLRRQHGGQFLVVDFTFLRGASRLIVALGDHREDRLTDALRQTVSQDGIIGDNRAAVVLAGNVSGREDSDHAWRRTHRIEIDRPYLGMRLPAEPEGAEQCAGKLRNVVGVSGFAGHVQLG